MNNNYQHEIDVQEFFQRMKEQDYDMYKSVADKYPVQDRSRAAVVRRREITVGLLGLSPSRISIQTADRNNTESIHSNREEG